MKPPAFDYVVPTTVAEAVTELAKHHGDARPLAGGQSLLPMLNFRLATPAVLVDLGRIPELNGITVSPSHVHVGAMTRTARLLEREVDQACPSLAAAARLVAHPQIRSRGTVGGSIANADPAAELPAVAVLTGASIRVSGAHGERVVPASAFFQGMFTTACSWDEIIVGIDFPRIMPATGWGFREFARRPGDFALAGVGIMLAMLDGTVDSAAIVVFGVGSLPLRMSTAEQALIAQRLSDNTLRNAIEAFDAELDPEDSVFASAPYRRQIAGVLFERAFTDAVSRAGTAIAGNGHA